MDRLADHPDESDRLLPLLAVAVRSLRGPEFRAGLTGVVWLLDRNPELRPAIAKQFPELVVSLTFGGTIRKAGWSRPQCSGVPPG